MARLALAALPGQPGALPTRHGSPVRLVATADLATLTANLTKRPGLAAVPPAVVETGQPGGRDISAMTVQVLACDADIVPTLTDAKGRALDVGTTIYAFPPKIRQAIEHRDRHCTYPGCTAPAPWCHGHHLHAFARGGPTSEANGTLLCGRHHRYIHAKGWTGHLADGHVVWRPPQPGDPPQPANAHTQAIEHALTQLAARWLARNPELHDTG